VAAAEDQPAKIGCSAHRVHSLPHQVIVQRAATIAAIVIIHQRDRETHDLALSHRPGRQQRDRQRQLDIVAARPAHNSRLRADRI
jgi:hypothetical protein